MSLQRRDDKHSDDLVEEIADLFTRMDGQHDEGQRRAPSMRITGDRRDARRKKPQQG